MKVLLDTCVWGGVQQALSAAGHDVIWTGDWDEDPGDDEILAYAHSEGRVLVTLDKDFGTLAFRDGRPHSGILRLVNLSRLAAGRRVPPRSLLSSVSAPSRCHHHSRV